jgi:SAM-dependent methyltransferase
MNENHNVEKTAQYGAPSYIWRAGQDRRLAMIIKAAGQRLKGWVLENGCGVGIYVDRLSSISSHVVGLEYDLERAYTAQELTKNLPNAFILNAASERLPFPDNFFSLILSHEVLEHVRDDQLAVREMVRTLKPGGRIVLFVPNRGYPYETHGIYWRKRYHFGNIPLVNYLPIHLRNRLAPHVRVYRPSDLKRLFDDQPVQLITHTVIFGAYDNIIARMPRFGRLLRTFLQTLEKTPLRVFGLSHFWIIEKT